MDAVWTVLGFALVALGLNDVFHTLLYPSGRGVLSHWALRTVWWASRRTGHRFGSLAGPLGVVLVIVLWGLVQAVGWALVFYPHVPENYLYSPGLDANRYNNFAEAFYISLVTVGTLGFGDVVPVGPWLRFVAPVEALVGFALLTAALSWFNQIYPALARRRALASRLRALRAVDYAQRVGGLDPASAGPTLDGLAAEVTAAHVTLIQNAETYYFHEVEEDRALATTLPYALELVAQAERSAHEETRLSGGMLRAAVDDFARVLRDGFRSTGGSTGEILASYAADHGFVPDPHGPRR